MRLEQAAANALEVMRFGRLGPRLGTPYAVVHQGEHYRLRRYGDLPGADRVDHDGGYASKPPLRADRPPILLVPPLMVTAEVYDVAPDISAVATLAAGGVDPWVIDFGAPEREAGGMRRTLDDHVRAVADAVRRVRAATERDVHLAGYSQGGMFAYQAAAYLGSESVASVITFGSPVDIHQNLPNVSTAVAGRIIQAARPLIEPTLDRIEGLPGVITSTAFKLVSVRKELSQLVDFVQKLHDRQALVKREARRRFLGGEGFVAWPGPALRTFVDEFIVHNRMLSGGFVVDGRTVTLADLRSPVLYFVGTRDEIARPPAVRAITRAAPGVASFEVALPAGHFGLVVGSAANRSTWPTVIEWIRWREGRGPRPALLPAEGGHADDDEAENLAIARSVDVELFYDVAVEALRDAWSRLGEAFVDAGDTADALRYQLPRLLRLRRLDDTSAISAGLTLAEQARAIPDRTFFLWKGRAFSYADADRRVDNVVRGLLACGVQAGDRVGVIMNGRPSYLTMVTACSRLGAVAVLVSPRLDDGELRRALELEPLRFVAADPESAARARAAFAGRVLVLGGGSAVGPEARTLTGDVVDMEAIDPAATVLPPWYEPNPGRAGDLALVIVTRVDDGAAPDIAGRSPTPRGGGGASTSLRAAHITNRRWALSALGAAAACTLTSGDTVYCCLPLHHPAGLLVAVGAALVGGSRLALATRFAPSVFWSEVQTYGATVVFYAGEMVRELLRATPAPTERSSPLRLFAGSGMRADAWRQLRARTGVGVLEFYAATEGALVLANAAGDKVGALGRPLPGSSEVALLAYDFTAGAIARDVVGRGRRVAEGEAGVLAARLDATMPAPAARVARDVLEPGDAWLTTGDLARHDADGDFWFVDRLADVIRTAEGPVPSRPIEDILYEQPEVATAVVYGVPAGAAEVPVAAVVLRSGGVEIDGASLFAVLATRHPLAALPRRIRVVADIPMTEGFRPLKAALRADGLTTGAGVLTLDLDRGTYIRGVGPGGLGAPGG